MSTYSDQDFEELKDLVEENHRILKRLNRRSNFSVAYSIIKWVVIIGIAIGAFTLLKPVAQQFWDSYQSISEGISSISEARDKIGDLSLEEFINLIRNEKIEAGN